MAPLLGRSKLIVQVWGRGHHEEHFNGFCFTFEPVVQEEMTFKIFYI